jgi:uncharacterized protein
MKTVYADTSYWVAIANPRDALHEVAKEAAKKLGPVRIITTDEVISEFLAFFSGMGQAARERAVLFSQKIMNHPNITVLPQTRESFRAGMQLYQKRLDKEYSLVDCTSMETMRQQGISEVLTSDHHFTQEGSVILMVDEST